MDKMTELESASVHVDAAPVKAEENMAPIDRKWWNWRVAINCEKSMADGS